MSELQDEYKTEVEEALTMLGVGYDESKPAVIIEKPRKDLALRESGLSEYKVWGWVKKSAKFIFHVRRLRGAKLSIWEVVSLSINEDGECALSLNDLVKLTGYSRSEVSESVKELEEMGYLSVQKEAGKKSIFKPSFTARGENSPSDEPIQKTDGLTRPVSKDNHPSSFSNINSAPSFERVKRVNTATPQNMPIEWYIQHDLPVPPELTQNNAAEAQAIHEFESAFGFSQLPWDTTSDWQAFKKWVLKIYQTSPRVFRDYVEWREGKGKYDAMSNKQIRLTPRAFMDTGYPTFKASAMHKTDEQRGEYRPGRISA